MQKYGFNTLEFIFKKTEKLIRIHVSAFACTLEKKIKKNLMKVIKGGGERQQGVHLDKEGHEWIKSSLCSVLKLSAFLNTGPFSFHYK
jgi:hypothetical protein